MNRNSSVPIKNRYPPFSRPSLRDTLGRDSIASAAPDPLARQCAFEAKVYGVIYHNAYNPTTPETDQELPNIRMFPRTVKRRFLTLSCSQCTSVLSQCTCVCPRGMKKHGAAQWKDRCTRIVSSCDTPHSEQAQTVVRSHQIFA